MNKKKIIASAENILVFLFRLLFNNRLIRKIKYLIDLANLPKFAYLGSKTQIFQPFYCGTPDLVKIGNNCRIGRDCEFGVVRDNTKDSKIIIGNNVWITARCQIYSKVKVEIDDDVLIAANVFICDYTHGYKQAANIPYQNQPFEPYGAIRVGRGTWIGQNCVILYGVNIGEQCIIGANSVVTKSIPDRCIVMGSPAKVTKIWDYERNIWVKP